MKRALILLLSVLGLSAQAQTTWTGAVSSDWNAAGNWSAGVPTGGTNVTIPAGTPNSPSTAGVASPVCRDLTINASATLTIAPGTSLDVHQNMTAGSDVVGGGLLRFVGATACNVNASTALPNLEVAKGSGVFIGFNGTMTVNGNFTLTSGAPAIGNFSAAVLTVTGDANFQGGTLNQGGAPGILDVAGNVTFSGAAGGTSALEIRCAGNWTSSAAFAPTNGLVLIDGSSPQTIAAAGPFHNLTVAGGANASTTALTVNSALTVNGVLAVSGALDANGNVTIGATGSLNVAGGTCTIAGNLTGNGGGFTGPSTVVFDGSGFGNVNGVSALPNVQVAKTGGGFIGFNGNTTVNGSLTLTSGTLTVGNFSASTMTVTGDANLQGGTLTQGAAPGILDVAGNVTFSGAAGGTSAIEIRCAGNWTSSVAFAPTNGLVLIDGSSPQTIAAAGPFHNLTVAGGATASTSALTVNSLLTVNGTLDVSGALDANGSVTVGATGSLNVAGGTCTIAGNLTGNGSGLTGPGTVVFDGSGSANVTSVSALPNVQVAKTGSAFIAFNGNTTVNGSLSLTSGTLTIGNFSAATITVTGSATLQGGTISQNSSGVLDVAGDVTFSGAAAGSAVPEIRCAANWTSNAAFAPANGLVVLDGTGPTTIAHGSPGGTMGFSTLVLKNGPKSVANDFTIAATTLTIDPGAALSIPTGRHLRVHRTGSTAFNVNGALSVAANGTLSMGPQTTAVVGATGSLSLLGSAGQPATLAGEAGGGYALTVNGTIAANHFVAKEMGPAGLFISVGATIAAAPNNLRNGTLDFRAGASAGSVLLNVRRQAPAADFDSLVFLNTPGIAGVFNATTAAGGMPIGFTNWSGSFGGPAFENDPAGLVNWNLQAAPPLTSFVVRPGAELAEITWTPGSNANVTNYQLFRSSSAAGPFTLRTTQAPATGHAFIDAPLAANQPVFYALYSLMTQGDLLFLASGSTTPYSSATPANIKKVGGNGTFATIQAAIDAATDPNSVVWVTPGTYDSFTIGATAVPSNLRILGDGTGPVNISTANGPVQILNVSAISGVELSNLNVGSAASSQGGIVISGCAGPVVLDELQVACDGAHTAISVSASPATAIQRSGIAGGVGLDVSNGSYVAISRGSLTSLVSVASSVEIATLTPGSTNVTPPSSLITRTGLMPDIDLPEFIPLSMPSALFLEAQPNAPFAIGASTRFGFLTSPAWEMPFLLDPSALTQLPIMMTDAFGNAVIGFEVEPIAALLGFSFTVQVVVADPVSGTPRLSNVESMVCIP